MKQNILTFGGIIVFVVVGFFLLNGGGGNSSTKTVSASTLESLESYYDFGTISMGNGDVAKLFEVKNTGTEPVAIEKVYTSCMCTTAKITDAEGNTYGPYGMPGHVSYDSSKIEIRGGETATVEAIFDPAAHGPSGIGLNQRVIYLETNSAQTPKVELKFAATVTN